ncbi:DUF416 family protein [Nitrosomonas europaea]|uniref:Uncharacterized protein n=1 Tax=Nitrosomonas europaea (strain ATCC 19718 / CIP 103999 / KCTC 2705 / NBRC 14298) TaxID=228410 RepID=Q82V43_NITEU|nr:MULTISPECIES: DUF416 family protein [Nitrosomonas]MBV6390144.1 hypothetical protein [Nitrosomonas europaea]CAD85170.1 hypothetical protein NE1259 [Nitrosomonas europaea ATCC 19718]SDW43799.1 Protein of unknown function [Nitrosomonas europaea]SET05169.1 Protein of unknown function [Nitrosomonas europaea]SJZ57765.1 Protein of unknown function [Nitrosomonas europaea]
MGVMKGIEFSESKLKEILDQLPIEAQSAFAASCAQRIFTCYVEYARVAKSKKVDLDAYSEAISYVWNAVIAGNHDAIILNGLLERCMAVLPSEEDAWESGTPYAEDAAAAIIYSLRSLASGCPQEAIWAAKRVYEAVDNFVVNTYNVNTNATDGEKFILDHPIVSNELSRQLRDLNEIINSKRDSESLKKTIKIIMERSKSESNDLFSEAT